MCLCPGDRLYWSRRLGPAVHYRGALADFPAFIEKTVDETGATDVVMLGDGRPYHAMALAVLAETKSAQPWIVEQGYLRPGLILVETLGTGGRSAAPGLFVALEPADSQTAPVSYIAPASFLRYALLDIGFHVSNLAVGWLTHPGYAHHALDGPVREYAGWISKGLRSPVRRYRTRRALVRLSEHAGSVFLLPLQLATDYQIRHHGTGTPLHETVARIIENFAQSAPPDALLAVKEHPLDNGLFDWHGFVLATARRAKVADRVVLLAGGDVQALLTQCNGVITVNSTVGLTALMAGTPCKVLGRAVYDLAGLTDPQPLETFWSAPRQPDPALLARYVGFLRSRFHIAGGFDGPAALAGASNLAKRLTAGPVAD